MFVLVCLVGRNYRLVMLVEFRVFFVWSVVFFFKVVEVKELRSRNCDFSLGYFRVLNLLVFCEESCELLLYFKLYVCLWLVWVVVWGYVFDVIFKILVVGNLREWCWGFSIFFVFFLGNRFVVIVFFFSFELVLIMYVSLFWVLSYLWVWL